MIFLRKKGLGFLDKTHLSGRLLITFVKESHEQKYSSGTVFVNHATGFIQVYMFLIIMR